MIIPFLLSFFPGLSKVPSFDWPDFCSRRVIPRFRSRSLIGDPAGRRRNFMAKKAISLANICQMWKRVLSRGSTSVFCNH